MFIERRGEDGVREAVEASSMGPGVTVPESLHVGVHSIFKNDFHCFSPVYFMLGYYANFVRYVMVDFTHDLF